MGKKGFLGVLIILILSILFGVLLGPSKISQMKSAIETDLNDAGYSDFANIDMSGNVATLTGKAPNEAAVTDAVNVAKNTKCPFCKNKDKRWHEVDNKLEFNSLPIESPFTFSGQKDADGRVSLTGFVGTEVEKASVIAKAQALFGDKLVSTSISVAKGSPNNMWNRVIESDMEQLAQLNSGRFEMKNLRNFITGEASDASTRDAVKAANASLPSEFKSNSEISVPNKVAQVETVSECQALFNDLKVGKSILFETSRANIKGATSFDLLNNIASAAQRCESFQITVAGHTDSVGGDELNQILSKQRADEVVNYLGQNGVDTSRLTARGFGETQPVASNDNAAGRAKNRRIEFTVTQSQ